MPRSLDQLFPDHTLLRPLWRRGLLWTLIVGLFLGLGAYYARREAREIALNRAQDSFRKDLAYRTWATQRGGVYVPLDEKTPANPYLKDIPNREITTTTGKVYTLVNPAYMTRMVHELGAHYGLKGHLTSLNPIRPENAPDAWERSTLQRFEAGAREYWDIQEQNGVSQLRYMGAFLVEQGCLRCHAAQGYRLGQVRGGISVSVPLAHAAQFGGLHHWMTFLALSSLWVIGLGAIAFTARQEQHHALERRKAVEALTQGSEQLQAMIQTTRDGYWVVDTEGRLLDVNEAYAQMSGYTREELLQMRVSDLEALESSEGVQQHIQTLREQGWTRFDTKHRCKSGRVYEVEVSASFNAGSERFFVYLRDITQENQVTQTLQESEGRFRALLDGVNLLGVMMEPNGKVLFANDALLAKTGWSRGEVEGKDWFERFIPGDREDVRGLLVAMVESGKHIPNYENPILTREGSLLEVAWNNTLLHDAAGRVIGVASLGEDITSRKRTEEGLKLSESRYQQLFETLQEGFALHEIVTDAEGRPVDYVFLEVNPAFEAMTGLSRGSVVGRRVREIIPNLETTWVERYGKVALSGVTEHFEDHVEAMGKWFDVHAFCPTPGHFATLVSDITARKEAEVAIHNSEALLRTYFDAAPDGIFVTNGEGRYLQVNRAAEAMTGYTAEELLKLNVLDLGAAERKKSLDHFGSLKQQNATTAEILLLRKDGSTIPVLLSAAKINDDLMIGLCRDLTESKRLEAERRRLEVEVQHSQQLESLGSLAGGIAHDMNNVLAAILGLGSVLQVKLAQDPPLLKAVDTILHAAGRGRDLVKGLTDFARKGMQEPHLLNLNDLVRSEAALLHRTTLQRVELVIDLDPDLPPILGEPNSLSSTLMNLCVNALDAMPKGGRLRLATRLQKGRVELTVEDTGEGMSPEVKQRALEPFFTTKPVGKGTGLGLSIVYGTLKAHGGSIDIQSEPGQGTSIRLSLPAMSASATEPLPTASPTENTGTALSVLLVDDDELIRESVPSMLETLGHRAVVASGGLEALRRLEAGLKVDLVILDMNMPGLSGVDTLGRIRLLRPELPILVTTGFREEGLDEVLASHVKVATLMKPYGMADLAAKLKEGFA